MNLNEIPVTEQTVYEGIIVSVRKDQAKIADGRLVNREVVEHPGGVAVFAVDASEQVVMVRQYRYPMGEVVLELPAGKLEPGEDPAECARRELVEETGITADEFLSLGCSYSSPGIFTEKIHLFLARGLHQGEACPDDGEYVDVLRIPLDELIAMVKANQIFDGKTMVGILKGMLLLRGEV